MMYCLYSIKRKMKHKYILLLCAFTIAIFITTSCKKESESIFDMFTDVSVTYHGDHPLSVTDYKLVNDGDSVYIDYTITSAKEDMYFIVVEKTDGSKQDPQRSPTPITDDNQRRTYSGLLKIKMLRDGKTSYRVYATNKKNYFIGDGGKTIVIDVKPSYIHTVNRRVYAPDTVTKVAPCYFSIKRGESFSYANGQENSSDIDFGLYRTWRINPDGSITYTYNIYSLSATPNPFTIYDISGWQKRATLFRAPIGNALTTYATTLASSQSIETEAKKSAISLKQTTTGITSGSLVYFLTPEGKYGAIYVNAVTKDLEGKAYADISVKVQK